VPEAALDLGQVVLSLGERVAVDAGAGVVRRRAGCRSRSAWRLLGFTPEPQRRSIPQG